MSRRLRYLLACLPLLVVGAVAVAQGYQPNFIRNFIGPVTITGDVTASGAGLFNSVVATNSVAAGTNVVAGEAVAAGNNYESYLQFNGGNSSVATISAQGTDSDISIAMTPTGAGAVTVSTDLTVTDDMSADDGTFTTVTFSGGGTPCLTRGGNAIVQTCSGDGFASLGTLDAQGNFQVAGDIRNTGSGGGCSGVTSHVCVNDDLAGASAGTTGWTIAGAGVAVFNTSMRLGFTTLGTCGAGVEGALRLDVLSGVSTAAATRLCLCRSDGAATYTWINVVTGTNGTATTCAP